APFWNCPPIPRAPRSRTRRWPCRKWRAGSAARRRARSSSCRTGSSASWRETRRSEMPAPRPIVIALSLAVAGCGWAPLYADPPDGPASAELRAIHVDPITERIGQRLELALRNSLNPTGEPTKERYRLQTSLRFSLSALGLVSQGTSTLGRIDLVATYRLIDLQ